MIITFYAWLTVTCRWYVSSTLNFFKILGASSDRSIEFSQRAVLDIEKAREVRTKGSLDDRFERLRWTYQLERTTLSRRNAALAFSGTHGFAFYLTFWESGILRGCFGISFTRQLRRSFSRYFGISIETFHLNRTYKSRSSREWNVRIAIDRSTATSVDKFSLEDL